MILALLKCILNLKIISTEQKTVRHKTGYDVKTCVQNIC